MRVESNIGPVQVRGDHKGNAWLNVEYRAFPGRWFPASELGKEAEQRVLYALSQDYAAFVKDQEEV